MANNNEIEPVFDMNNSDWDYLAWGCIGIRTSFGDIDISALFYKDGGIKIMQRALFPSGSKIKATNSGFSTLAEAIQTFETTAQGLTQELPGKILTRVIILNTSTKAKDLFDLMCQHPDLEITSKTERLV